MLQGDHQRILKMIDDNEPLVRKYGAIAAKRIFQDSPELIVHASSSKDSDIQQFAQDVIDVEAD